MVWSSADLMEASSVKITEFFADVHPLFALSYNGPDAEPLDKATFDACGWDNQRDEALLRLRCQAVSIQAAIGSVGPSTLAKYTACLVSGWAAGINERNAQPEHANDQLDYVAHPMSKVMAIVLNHIIPKLKANPAASEFIANFNSHVSAIELLKQAQMGVPYIKGELRSHQLIKGLGMEELKAQRNKRKADANLDLAEKAKSKYFTPEEMSRYIDECIVRCDYHSAAAFGLLLATGLRKAQIPQMKLGGCFLIEVEAWPFPAQILNLAFRDSIKDKTHEGKDMVTAMLPGLDALRCVPGLLAEKYIADGLGGNKLDIADLVLHHPDVFKNMTVLYHDPAHPNIPDEGGQKMFDTVRRAQQRSDTLKEHCVTKSGRITAAVLGAMSSVPYEEIRHHQGWAGGAMESSYMKRWNAVNLKMYLVLAGFDGNRRFHFAYRQDIPVEEKWVDAVFPRVRDTIAALRLVPKENRPPGAVTALQSLLFLGKVFWRNVPVKVEHYQGRYNLIYFAAIQKIMQTPEYADFKAKILHADRLAKAAHATAGAGVPLELAAAALPGPKKSADVAIRKVMPRSNLKNLIDLKNIKSMQDFWGVWVKKSPLYKEHAGKQEKSLVEEKSRSEALANLIQWKAQEGGVDRAVEVAQGVKEAVDRLAGRPVPVGAFADAVRAVLYAGKVVPPKRKGTPCDLTRSKINRTEVLFATVAELMGVEVPPSC